MLRLLIMLILSTQLVYANQPAVVCNKVGFVTGLNHYLNNPEYKVIFLVRHGHAVQEGKSSTEAKMNDPELRRIDKARPLDNKGLKGARKLANVIAELVFGNVAMFASDAVRVRDTGLAVYDLMNAKNKSFTAEDSLYYADVEVEMSRRLMRPQFRDVNHAFFCGHGKTTMALFKKLTGATVAENKTAGVMAVAIKAENWESFFQNKHSEVQIFSWSPKDTNVIGFESTLESLPGSMQESVSFGSPHDAEYHQSVRSGVSWFDLTN